MKICIIVCWFGKLPNYFELWKKSCLYNKDYDFLLITDQDYSIKEKNIKIIKMELEELKKLINNKLKLNIKFIKPYKICDFRPAFGVIFKEYLQSYEFWGHCDIDQIFGNLSDFINDDLLKSYDKINRNGHFTLYRNCEKINNLFRSQKCKFYFEEVFNSNENYAFDEYTGIDYIAKQEKIKEKDITLFADISVKHKRYKIVQLNNYKIQSFIWDNGKLYRIYKENNNDIKMEEMMYIHFQKKIPNVEIKNNMYKSLIIGSQYIKKIDSENISEEDIIKSNPYQGTIYENIEKIKYIVFKVKQFLKSSINKKCIWIKQKI